MRIDDGIWLQTVLFTRSIGWIEQNSLLELSHKIFNGHQPFHRLH